MTVYPPHSLYTPYHTGRAAARLQPLAEERGENVLALSLQWVYAREAVTSVILGFSSPDQLRQNLDALEQAPGAPLPEEELDQVWRTLTGNRFSYHRGKEIARGGTPRPGYRWYSG